MVDVNWVRKVEILKAIASEPETSLVQIGQRFNVSKGTIYNTLNQFTTTYQLTEDESDFPRKLLKLYNVNIPDEGGGDKLDRTDVQNLRHHVERARKREGLEDEIDSLPTDFSNQYRGEPTMSYSQQQGPSDKNFDKTTEDGLWRSILYSAKNVNPQANERFINLYNMGKKGYQANPQALLDLMRHMFGPGFGTDAFNLFHTSKGEYISEQPGAPSVNPLGGGMDPMMIMAMIQGGGDMSQMLPLLMQGGGMGGGNSPMSQAMQFMIINEFKKQSEKKERQEQWDQMMNMMMLKMIGGTMDSRTQMDAASGNFMVNEILDKDRNVTKRELVPMATILSNPLMAQGIFNHGGQTDETTQAVLKNALEEKSKMMELYMQNNQPMMQVFASLLSNYQSRNDQVQMISTLMDIQDKFIKPGGADDPEIERLKIDLQLATNQQNMTLEQMKHQWEMEKEEKKAGSENVKSWMSMIGQVGEKLAAPAMQIVAGGMGKGAGLLNQGGQGPGGGLPPLGASGPVHPGGLDVGPQQQQQPPPRRPSPQPTMGPTLGVPDPDHNQHLLGPDPSPNIPRNPPIDPERIMMATKLQQTEQMNQQMMNEINRLRNIIVSGQNEPGRGRHQLEPVVDKEKLAKLSDAQIDEMLESLKGNEQEVERARQILEAEKSDREWLSTPPPEVDEVDTAEANRIAKQNEEDANEPQPHESLEEEHYDPEAEEETAPVEASEDTEEEPQD